MQLKSDILCIDSYVGIREMKKKEKDIVNSGNKTVTEVKLTKENNIAKKELDAVSDLISKGEFEIDMEEGTHTEVKFSKSKNEETPKISKYKSNICLPPKKRKQFSGFEIVKSRKALKFEIPGEPVSFSLIICTGTCLAAHQNNHMVLRLTAFH